VLSQKHGEMRYNEPPGRRVHFHPFTKPPKKKKVKEVEETEEIKRK
jgi:hypothetical protein